MGSEADAPAHAEPSADSAPREIYVYYRVPSEAAPAARDVVEAAQAALRAAYPGLLSRLLRRRDDADTQRPETWMEIYALPASPGGVDGVLQGAIEAMLAPLAPLIDGPRHVEVFAADGAACRHAPEPKHRPPR